MVWKKQKTRKGFHLWKKPNENFIYVNGTYTARGDRIYEVCSIHKNFGVNNRNFDTMQKALKYASDFMKNNP